MIITAPRPTENTKPRTFRDGSIGRPTDKQTIAANAHIVAINSGALYAWDYLTSIDRLVRIADCVPRLP